MLLFILFKVLVRVHYWRTVNNVRPLGSRSGITGRPVHDLWSPIKDDNIDNKTHADFIVRNIMETVRYYRPHVPHECGLITDKAEWRPDTGELKFWLDDSIGGCDLHHLLSRRTIL